MSDLASEAADVVLLNQVPQLSPWQHIARHCGD
jgi:hypothetical protein